jgi:protein Xni
VANVLLLDTFNLIRRLYEANPAGGDAIDDVVEASRRALDRALRQHQPSHAVSVVDSHEETWRHQLYSGYKSGRAPTPPALMDHLQDFKAAFASLGVQSLEVSHYEADDVIGTLAQGVADSGGQVIIISTDKVFLQLLSPQVRVYHHFEREFVSPADVQHKFGLTTDQLPDLWALAGDPTNSIKGIPRIGKKTAQALLQSHGSLAQVLATPLTEGAAEVSRDPAVARVLAHRELALCCQQLARLKTDVALGINLRDYRCSIQEE